MNNILKFISASFDGFTPGASAKKLSAFMFMLCCVYIHIRFIDLSNCIEALIIDASTMTALLGVSTIQSMKVAKEPKSEAI